MNRVKYIIWADLVYKSINNEWNLIAVDYPPVEGFWDLIEEDEAR